MSTSHKVVSGSFFIMMCALLMVFLYRLFFGFGDWEGALFYTARQVETPIARYYYSYCYLPNIHMESDTDFALNGVTYSPTTTTLYATSADLNDDYTASGVFNMNTTVSDHYSSGWE